MDWGPGATSTDIAGSRKTCIDVMMCSLLCESSDVDSRYQRPPIATTTENTRMPIASVPSLRQLEWNRPRYGTGAENCHSQNVGCAYRIRQSANVDTREHEQLEQVAG